MAIINKNKKPYSVDENKNIFIGLDLPIRKSDGAEGYFKSTETTIESVKNNIRSLLLTNSGERLMQPTIGMNFKKYLFEQFTEDLQDKVKSEILDKFNFWLPFVNITNVDVSMNKLDSIGQNEMNIKVTFNITKDTKSLHSVQVIIN